MIDKRLKQFAHILVTHSLGIKKNDLFVIRGNSLSAPLIMEVYRQALQLGAYPYVRVDLD